MQQLLQNEIGQYWHTKNVTGPGAAGVATEGEGGIRQEAAAGERDDGDRTELRTGLLILISLQLAAEQAALLLALASMWRVQIEQ